MTKKQSKTSYINCFRHNNFIYLKYIDQNNERKLTKIDISKPSKFKLLRGVNTKSNSQFKDKFGNNAVIKKLDTVNQFYELKDTYPYIHILPQYQFIHYLYYNKQIPIRLQHFKIINFDIEVFCEKGFPQPLKAEYPVNSIALQDLNEDKFYLISYPYIQGDYFTPTNEFHNVEYFHCENEKQLLEKFLQLWRYKKWFWYPDIVTGWFIKIFDIPYLYNRIKKVLGEEKASQLSPINKLIKHESNKKKVSYDIVGVSQLDYVELYKNYVSNRMEKYSLNFIAKHELNEEKVDYGDDYGSLANLYKENYQLFLEYNLKDVDLVGKLENKLKLFKLVNIIAYLGLTNFEDVLSTTVKYFDVFFTWQALNERKVVF